MILERDDFGQVHGTFQRDKNTAFVEFVHGFVNNIFLDKEKKTPYYSLCSCCNGLVKFSEKHPLYIYKGNSFFSILSREHENLGKNYSLKEFSDDLVEYMKTPQQERKF